MPSGAASGLGPELFTSRRFAALLGLMVFAAFPGILLGSATFVVRDYGLFSFPVAWFQRECFWHGELPFWNPYSYCGIPFLAQWNTMALYPPALLYLLLPPVWGLGLFCLFHLFWGGFGAFLLAEKWSGHRLAAALAGVAFAFNGLTLNFLMWPSHVATLSWVPWLLWLAPAGWREGGRKLAIATACGAMQMLAGGPETILFTWVLLLVLAAADWIAGRESRRRIVFRFVLLGTLVALICAPQLLPFLELLSRSQRESGYGSGAWSMPVWGWANLVCPLFRTMATNQGVYFQPNQGWTSSYYIGGGILLLVAAGAWRGERRARVFAALAALAMILALGNNGVLYSGLRSMIPALGFLRYPVKFVLLAIAAVPVLAACGFAALERNRKDANRFGMAGAGLIVAVMAVLTALDWNSAASRANGLVRIAFFLALATAAACYLRSRGAARSWLGLAVVVLCWLDLLMHVPTQNPTALPTVYAPGFVPARVNWDPPARLGSYRALLAPAAQERLKYHTLPNVGESYLLSRVGLLANCNLLDNIPQAHGFFSLTPAEINNLTAAYYLQTNRDFATLLDFMGVARVNTGEDPFQWQARSSQMPMVTAGQQPVFVADQDAFEKVCSTNSDLRNVVLLPEQARSSISAGQAERAGVISASVDTHKITIETDFPAPAIVVIAQTFYPAWKARLEGQSLKLWRANYGFQALQVPPGRHTVTLTYKDMAFRVGLLLCAPGLLIVLAMLRKPKAQG